MMKSEFLDRIKGNSIPDADYQIVETVYTYHPANWSKDTCAAVYDLVGMVPFRAMLEDAKKSMEFEQEIQRRHAQVQDVRDQFEAFKEHIFAGE